MKRLATTVTALWLGLPVAARAAGRMQPGLWEVTATVELPGVPSSPPPTVQTECLSQADVDADPVPEIDRGACKVTDVRRDGARVSWKVDCGQIGKGDGEVTYRSATSYDGWMKLATGGTVVRTTLRARRLRGC